MHKSFITNGCCYYSSQDHKRINTRDVMHLCVCVCVVFTIVQYVRETEKTTNRIFFRMMLLLLLLFGTLQRNTQTNIGCKSLSPQFNIKNDNNKIFLFLLLLSLLSFSFAFRNVCRSLCNFIVQFVHRLCLFRTHLNRTYRCKSQNCMAMCKSFFIVFDKILMTTN